MFILGGLRLGHLCAASRGENTAVVIDGPPLQPSPRINNQVQFERNGKWRNDARIPHDRDAMQLPTRNVALPDNPEDLGICEDTSTTSFKAKQITSTKNFPCLRRPYGRNFSTTGDGEGISFEKSRPSVPSTNNLSRRRCLSLSPFFSASPATISS